MTVHIEQNELSDSQRVLMATWWIAGIVLTTFYTANLTASLARPFRAKSVQYPAELSLPDYKDVRWTTLQGEAFYALIEVSKSSFDRSIRINCTILMLK